MSKLRGERIGNLKKSIFLLKLQKCIHNGHITKRVSTHNTSLRQLRSEGLKITPIFLHRGFLKHRNRLNNIFY